MQNGFENIEQLIATNPLLAVLLVFAAGVGVSFTPCVYPVIPITLGYIGARSAGSRWRGLALSLVYVLGMALTYAVLGAFAALTGQLFGKIGSSPWSYLFVGIICFLLGLSMLGVFELPQISFKWNTQRKGFTGAFVVGVISGVIVGPCTAPVMAALLVYVSSRQNVLYGFLLLFIFGYGVGFLMILLGTFSGLLTSLPKSGAWLERVKKAFGCILLLAAVYLFVKMGILFR